MSTAARGLTAVTTETRFAAAETSRRASSSSGAISSRSASRTRSRAVDDLRRCVPSTRCARGRAAARPAPPPPGRAPRRAPPRGRRWRSPPRPARAGLRRRSSRTRPATSRPTIATSASAASTASTNATIAERLRAREQVLDQPGDGEPEAERDEAAERRPEQRAPRQPASPRRRPWRERHRQRLAVRLGRDQDGAARAPPRRLVGVRHDDARIVDAKRRRLALLVHGQRRHSCEIVSQAGIAAHGRGGCGAGRALRRRRRSVAPGRKRRNR